MSHRNIWGEQLAGCSSTFVEGLRAFSLQKWLPQCTSARLCSECCSERVDNWRSYVSATDDGRFAIIDSSPNTKKANRPLLVVNAVGDTTHFTPIVDDHVKGNRYSFPNCVQIPRRTLLRDRRRSRPSHSHPRISPYRKLRSSTV
jgi:hypothetical protein